MSQSKFPSAEFKIEKDFRAATSSQSVDTGGPCGMMVEGESTRTPPADLKQSVLEQNASESDMCEKMTKSDSFAELISAVRPDEEETEARHFSECPSDATLKKKMVSSRFISQITPTGNNDVASSRFPVKSATKIELSSLHPGGVIMETKSKPGAFIGSPVVDEEALSGISSCDVYATQNDVAGRSNGRGRPQSEIESFPSQVTQVQTAKKMSDPTMQTKYDSSNALKSTHAPPVLQPEVITVDDDKPSCDFEEPPLLLPQVAMTRKRKGIVQKRSFFGDIVDSSILKESVLEDSPGKRFRKSEMACVVQSKPSAQDALTIAEDDVTMVSRFSGNIGNADAPQPKMTLKTGGATFVVDRNKIDNSVRSRLNRYPTEEKASHGVFCFETNDKRKTGQRSLLTYVKDRPLARRMGLGRQLSRRSGAVRCRTYSVQDQSRSVDGNAVKNTTSTGWRSVKGVQLRDVTTHCDYFNISKHNREVFAPLPPPPGDLIAPLRDPEFSERVQKVVDGIETDPMGVFTSAALEGFLDRKAPLKLSFPVPDCFMPRENPVAENAVYPPRVQRPPTAGRRPGEPRFKTLLEKNVWLGVRDEKELKAVRSAPSPSKDAAFSETLPLHSLLLPPRYLTPARSSRDLSVYRGRHLLPLRKVMHKSLSMRRAWDEPARGADCVQFIYDRQRQVYVRGSRSVSAGPKTRAYGKLLRSETAETMVNAWHQNDYQVSIEPVSRQEALLVAAAVVVPRRDLASGSSSAHLRSPRFPGSNSQTLRSSPPAACHSFQAPRRVRRVLREDHDKDGKIHRISALRTTLAVEEEDGSVLFEREQLSSKRVQSTDEHEKCSMTVKQNPTGNVTAYPATDPATNKGEPAGCHDQKIVVEDEVGDINQLNRISFVRKVENQAGECVQGVLRKGLDHLECKHMKQAVEEREKRASVEDQVSDCEKDIPVTKETVGTRRQRAVGGVQCVAIIKTTMDEMGGECSESSKRKFISDICEHAISDHQTDNSLNRANTLWDVRNENIIACDCQERCPEQRLANVDLDRDCKIGGPEDCCDEEKHTPCIQKDKMNDQKIEFCTKRKEDAPKHAENVLLPSNQLLACSVAMEEDGPFQYKSVPQPALQRSYRNKTEMQARRGGDPIQDLSAQADAVCNHGNALEDSESQTIGLKILQKMKWSETRSTTEHVSERAVADTVHIRESVDGKESTHHSFLKLLLEKHSDLHAVCVSNDELTTFVGVSSVENEEKKAVQSLDKTVVKTVDTNKLEEVTPTTTTFVRSNHTKETMKSEEQGRYHIDEMLMENEPDLGRDIGIKLAEQEMGSLSVAEGKDDGKQPSAASNVEEGVNKSDFGLSSTSRGDDAAKNDGTMLTTGMDQFLSDSANEQALTREHPPVPYSSIGEPSVVREACVHLPRFHLNAVRHFCLFHEVHDCEEYRPGGNCYMAPPRSRIQQLQRNMAIRTGRLPTLPARHRHAARTYGRVQPKKMNRRHVIDSCVALPPVPDGTVLPPVHASHMRPAPHRVTLPESVRISQVCEVVLLTPVRPGSDCPCHGVRLHDGRLVRLGPGRDHISVEWHVQPADDVIVTATDGRRFRNPQDRGLTTFVDVEVSAAEVIYLPLDHLNRSLSQGRMALLSESEGGLTLTPTRMRVMCRDRLRRVTYGQDGRQELFGTGSVAAINNSGQLEVIGAVPPLMALEDAADSPSKVEYTSRLVRIASEDGVKRSTSGPSAKIMHYENDHTQAIKTMHGNTRDRQLVIGHKRAAEGDANPTSKKRQRLPDTWHSLLKLTKFHERKELKVSPPFSQLRSKDGKFAAAAKGVAKSSDARSITNKSIRGPSKAGRSSGVSAKSAINVNDIALLGSDTRLTSASPEWVMNRLHSVTVEVLPTNGKSVVTKRSPEPKTAKLALTSAAASQLKEPASMSGRSSRPLSATDVLMSVVERIAKSGTKRVNKGPSTKPTSDSYGEISSQRNPQCADGNQQKQESVRIVPGSDKKRGAARKSDTEVKLLSPSKPLNIKSVPTTSRNTKSGGDVSPHRSLPMRSFVAEPVVVQKPPNLATGMACVAAHASVSRSAKRPGHGPRHILLEGPETSDETAPRVSDPPCPTMCRKGWTDELTSRRNWADNKDIAKGAAGAAVLHHRPSDNPATRRSWMPPQTNISHLRRNAEDTGNDLPRFQADVEVVISRRAEESQSACSGFVMPAQSRDGAAVRQSPAGSRPLPTLLRCDGVAVRARWDGAAEMVQAPPAPPGPALVDLTSPEKEASSLAADAVTPARRRPKLPLEVTLLNESDMSDDGLDELEELEAALPADGMAEGNYFPSIELIEL